jgi:hypothetical protein
MTNKPDYFWSLADGVESYFTALCGLIVQIWEGMR